MALDRELLRSYAETNSEDAFAELVRRHVDLVYSAALRQVNGDAHLAQDVAQTVFRDLARKAALLSHRQVLTGWLYTSTHFAAAKAVRTERRRHTHEQEAHAMHELLHAPAPDFDWEKLRPVLDQVMHELKESDRDVILMRYFENRQLADIGERLGLSEDAARKRVDRALEKLRIFLSKCSITTTAVLATALSANAVQSAPIGLAATISAAAALAGTTLAATATATTTQTMAMTTLQKTLITTAIAAAVGTGIYQARQAATLRTRLQTLQQQQAPLAEQNLQLTRERDDATSKLAALGNEIGLLNRNTAELLKLRGEVGVLQQENKKLRGPPKDRRNQLHFDHPFYAREEWAEKGTDQPLDTLQTVLWAMKQGDDNKLNQLVFRENPSMSLDYLLLPKNDWERLTGVQIVNLTDAGVMRVEGKLQHQVQIETILEKKLKILEKQSVIDQSIRRWSFLETNGQWLVTGGR